MIWVVLAVLLVSFWVLVIGSVILSSKILLGMLISWVLIRYIRKSTGLW